jgi:hypothetical protein
MKYTDTDNDNDKKRNKAIAFITTVVLHGLLLLCFAFMGLTHQMPPPPEYGIEVDMGGGGGGGSRTYASNNINAATPASSTSENIATQNTEESVNLNATRRPTTNPTRPNPVQTENENRTEETPVVNPNALFRRNASEGGGGSGTGAGTGMGSGTGSGTGSNFGSGAGNGGGDFFLDGRPVINKAFPKAKNNMEGVVKVDFRADKEGNVVYAKAGGRGTTINDQQIWEECERAARLSKFKAKSDAQAEEKGVITYRFIIQ